MGCALGAQISAMSREPSKKETEIVVTQSNNQDADNPCAVQCGGPRCLHYDAVYGKLEQIKAIIKAEQGRWDYPNAQGHTPLRCACDRITTMVFLIDAGHNLDSPDIYEMLADRNFMSNNVLFFIEKGNLNYAEAIKNIMIGFLVIMIHYQGI